MIYSIYDEETGLITGQITCSEDSESAILASRSNLIKGQYEIGKYQLINNQIIKVVQEDNTVDLLKTAIRSIRNDLLSAVDRINPVWYASLTSEQQQELAAYRQQLLNVPQQLGFPETIEWPAKPTWL